MRTRIDPAAGTSLTATRTRLDALLQATVTTDLADVPAWDRLREQARGAIGALIAGDALPGHLAVTADEPPVVVTRSLIAAQRRLHRTR